MKNAVFIHPKRKGRDQVRPAGAVCAGRPLPLLPVPVVETGDGAGGVGEISDGRLAGAAAGKGNIVPAALDELQRRQVDPNQRAFEEIFQGGERRLFEPVQAVKIIDRV